MSRPNIARVSSLLTSYWRGAVVHAAIKVGLFETLKWGCTTHEKVAEMTGCVPHLVLQVLTCLEKMNLVKSCGGYWGLTEEGAFLAKSSPYTLASSALMWWQEHLDSWRNLDYTLRTGKPAFEALYGKNFFQWLDDRDEARQLYHESMREYARIDYEQVPGIIQGYYPKRLIDVGGGTGLLSEMILDACPQTEVHLLDKPKVINDIEKINLHEKYGSRFKLLKGDLFDLPKSQYDAIILSRVLHDWGEIECILILKGIKDLLAKDGHVFIIDRIPSSRTEASLVNLDLAVITGGVEHSYHELDEMLSLSGLKIKSTRDLFNGLRLIIVGLETLCNPSSTH